MSHPSYPVGSDLQAFLVAATFDVTAIAPLLDDAMSGAVAEFERRVQRRMLADTSPSARTFDPPDNGDEIRIDDLASTPSIAYQPAGNAAIPYVSLTDYWLLPQNAPSMSPPEPYTRIRFRRAWVSPLWPSDANSIQITGRWGYGASISPDVWNALLAQGALSLYPQLSQETFGGVSSWTRSGNTESYGVDPLGKLRDAWEKKYEKTVTMYRRWSI